MTELNGPRPLLEVEGLSRAYRGVTAVADVSFEVRSGQVVGLLGPNGSGKSTTLHSITGIIEPGPNTHIRIDGDEHTSSRAKNALGFVPDDLPLPGNLTGREFLALHRRIRATYDDHLASELLDMVGLTPSLRKLVGEYSHGMRKKLQLVTALAHRPRFLVLDEPMRGLDPEAGLLMREVIEEFRRNNGAVLVATHDLDGAESYCDWVVVLSDGEVVASGVPSVLVAAAGVQDLEQFFLGVTGLAAAVPRVRAALANLKLVD